MNKILREASERTLSMAELRKIIPRYCKVKRYDALRGKTLKDVMGSSTVLIVLWNIHDKKPRVLNTPGHFFVISKRGPETCVVFSSTGMTPKKELFITQSDPEVLTRILPSGTVYNNVKLQVNRDSNTCWRWGILFAHFAPMGLKKFQQLFTRPHIHISNADMLVTALTLMKLY